MVTSVCGAFCVQDEMPNRPAKMNKDFME
jgi:hypothetical protein